MLKNALWLFAFAVALLLVFLPSYAKMQDLKDKNDEYARRIEVLQKRNARLEQEQHLLETDPVYLEKVARQRMGLIRDGETVYKIVPATKAKPAAKKQ
jgi:cell division protein FtsB